MVTLSPDDGTQVQSQVVGVFQLVDAIETMVMPELVICEPVSSLLMPPSVTAIIL